MARLWKGNRTDAEYELSDEAIAEGFWLSKWRENVAYGWPLERAIVAYITSPEPDGLNSTWDIDDRGVVDGVYDAVRSRWPEDL